MIKRFMRVAPSTLARIIHTQSDEQNRKALRLSPVHSVVSSLRLTVDLHNKGASPGGRRSL
jgi:hypothetical protein